jgi:DHA3 family macrolide efflux protein-like MFS transporter
VATLSTLSPTSIKRLRIFRTLSYRPIFILWAGEAFSAIGDEIYKVALIWLAVKMVGSSAGYLAAGQAASVLVVGLIGGIWADRWDPRKTMICVDWIRGLLVLVPVFWVKFFPLNMGVLVFVALAVSGFSAFFEPALQSVIPRLAQGRELMQATNGLMGTTSRLARTVGPGLVGLLTGWVPIIDFFTLDSVSFAVSALAVKSLYRELPEQKSSKRRIPLHEAILSGFRLIEDDARMKFIIYGKSVISGGWSIIFPLGIALLVQENYPGDVRAYGFLMASYGVGNLLSAVILTNINLTYPMRRMGQGFVLIGAGFVAMAFFKSMPLMMLSAAVSAVGGPLNDLAHLDMFQQKYSSDKLSQVVRFRMVVECAGILTCLLIAPLLFRLFPVRVVIGGSAMMIALVGVVGLLFFQESGKASGERG